jgi:hypothetical protein
VGRADLAWASVVDRCVCGVVLSSEKFTPCAGGHVCMSFVWGVAGWNIETRKSCACFCGGCGGFGMLLGPEETPVGGFLGAVPGLDRLTHP